MKNLNMQNIVTSVIDIINKNQDLIDYYNKNLQARYYTKRAFFEGLENPVIITKYSKINKYPLNKILNKDLEKEIQWIMPTLCEAVLKDLNKDKPSFSSDLVLRNEITFRVLPPLDENPTMIWIEASLRAGWTK